MVISYDNAELEGEPIFLVTNKTNRTQPAKIAQLYMYRDPIEHFIRDSKQEHVPTCTICIAFVLHQSGTLPRMVLTVGTPWLS